MAEPCPEGQLDNAMHGRYVVGKRREHGEVSPTKSDLRELSVSERVDEQDDFYFARTINIVQILLRWKWLFLAVMGFCVVAAAIWAAVQTPLYLATATLELNPAPARVLQIGEMQESRQSDTDFLALQLGLIKSRSLAERVARTLELGRSEEFLGYAPPANAPAETAVGPLMSGLSARGTASDRIMQISFVHPDPSLAARVANAYAEQAVEATFDRALQSTARSRAFLQRQLEATRQELERSERELIGYARAANIVNVQSQEGATSADSAGGTLVATNLVALNSQLADAQNARIVAQQRFAQAAASARAAAGTDPTVQSLQQQRAQLQAEYEQKQERYLPDHPEITALRARLAGLSNQISEASSRTTSTVASSLRADMVAAQNRERQISATINQLETQLLNLNDRGVRYTILRRSVEANRSLYNALLAKLGEENTSATRTSSMAVVDEAQRPAAPFSPNVPRALVLGLLAGMVLGAGSCVAMDRWRDTIDAPGDVSGLGLPLLGVIPRLAKQEEMDAAIATPRSALAEAYHSTRVALQFVSREGIPKSISFTSARSGEGKTSSVIAIAAGLIGVGMRVVVLDADLRRPSLRGDSKDGGLTDILNGTVTMEQAIASTETIGLYLIHAGTVPPDPTVLLTSRAFADLIHRLEQDFDIVLIDGPPVLGLADALLISAASAATVMVIEAGKTRRAVAAAALSRLYGAGAVLVGGILTKFRQHGHGYGYSDYGYEYEYHSSDESRSRSLIGPPPRVEKES